MKSQEEYVLRTVEERGIRFVQLWFTDVLGTPKTFSITPAELENALDEGMTFDGSAIDGFSRVQESDVLARPDPNTFQLLPWHGQEGAGRPPLRGAQVARVFCDIVDLDGTPFEGCPRHVLKRTPRAGPGPGLHLLRRPRDGVLLLRRRRPRPTRRPASTRAPTSTSRWPTWPATSASAPSSPSRRWASRSSTPSTRTPPASTRSTCATPTP